MSPITHFLVGWSVANVAPLERRDRAIVAFASVAPDLDGFGVVTDLVTSGSAHATDWWGSYHHVLGHNLGFGLIVLLAAFCFGRRRILAAGLAFASFHLHLLGDVAGSRGPDGFQWPIAYLSPFSDSWQWVWSGQWELNAWPNFVVTAGLLTLTLYWAWKRAVSPLEIVSGRADRKLVIALRVRFGRPASGTRQALSD